MENTHTSRGKIFIISGPSGSGQDSVIEGIRKYFPVERVITTTTRQMRPGESQKNPYYFIMKKEFLERIARNDFAEYAKEYNDNYYGVAKEELDRVRNSGKVGIWKMEYRGVITAKKLFPGIVAILITASSPDTLEKRIRARGGMTEEQIKERMEYTKKGLKYNNIYDYTVFNENGQLDKAVQKTAEIIQKHLS